MKRLQNESVILRDRFSKLQQKLVEFEYSTNNLGQYGRRNNIVISDIPDSIDVYQLEESVTEILADINVVASNDLKLAIESVRRILELAALKLLFVL